MLLIKFWESEASEPNLVCLLGEVENTLKPRVVRLDLAIELLEQGK